MPTSRTLTRREDDRFIRGEGSYTADLKPDGKLHLVFVRSAYAHALINAIDIEGASQVDGVCHLFSH